MLGSLYSVPVRIIIPLKGETVYHQTLVTGLKGAKRKPTNLAKVREVVQGPTESPSVFLE